MATSHSKWFPRKTAWSEVNPLGKVDAITHPLRPLSMALSLGVTPTASRTLSSSTPSAAATKVNQSSNVTVAFFDPLGAALEVGDNASTAPVLDPLSQLALEGTDDVKNRKKDETTTVPEFDLWVSRRQGILDRYTTNEKLSIVSSFLSGGVAVQSQMIVDNKVKHRLEQLDNFECSSLRQMLDLSQQDFIRKINDLSQALTRAWEQDQRVMSIKIAIQCAKMLSDTNVIRFYPSKFVLITDLLDTFGHLVYSRLFAKAVMESNTHNLQSTSSLNGYLNFSPDKIPDATRETCRNWFYKVASVRELLPRVYLEAAILKSLMFLNPGSFQSELKRLVLMCRGIGDPLVACYARCYVCRVGMSVNPSYREHVLLAVDDFVASARLLRSERVERCLDSQKLLYSLYYDLFQPALDWIVYCLACDSSCEEIFDFLLHKYFTVRMQDAQTNSNHISPGVKGGTTVPHAGLMLNAILKNAHVKFVASRALDIWTLINEFAESAGGSIDVGYAKPELVRNLGKCLVAQEPSDDKYRILNDVWRYVMKLERVVEYMHCAEVWLEFACVYFGSHELNTLLGDVVAHLLPDRAFEQHYRQLQIMLDKLLHKSCTQFAQFLKDTPNFVAFLDLFQRDAVRVDMSRKVVETFCRYQLVPCQDLVIAGHIIAFCKCVHDSLNAMSLEDERRNTAHLICTALDKFHFQRDFEQQLTIYVDSRGSFCNLDGVLVHLVRKVNRLAVETRIIRQGRHTKKTAGFVRACAAFSYITVPSLADVGQKIQLYIESAEVALANQCLPQADAMLKSAIALVLEVPLPPKLVPGHSLPVCEVVRHLLSLLLVVPDSPEQEMLYLQRGLLNAVAKYPWPGSAVDVRAKLYITVLAWLSVASRSEYPFHVAGVESNDTLYGNDPKFLGELQNLASTVLDLILADLKALGVSAEVKRQAALSLDLLECILMYGEIKAEAVATLAVNVWNLAQKHGHADRRRCSEILADVEHKRIHSKAREKEVWETLAQNFNRAR